MTTITGLGLMLLVLLPLWALLASPFLAAFALTNRYRRRKELDSAAVVVACALLFAVLLAPTPTPIVTILIPLGFALLLYDETFLVAMPSIQIWLWAVVSFITTFLGLLVFMHYAPRLWPHVSKRTKKIAAAGASIWVLASLTFIAFRVVGA